MDQFACHGEHAPHALGVDVHLLFSLGDIELGSREDTGRDEFELELVVALMLGGDKEFHNLHINLCEPYHDGKVDEVEDRVEHG